jgi:PAS domain S-box-containing protein
LRYPIVVALSLRATVPLVAAMTAVLASAVTTPLGVLTARANIWADVDAATRQLLLQTDDVLRVVPHDGATLNAVVATAEHVPFATRLAIVDDVDRVRARWPVTVRADTWTALAADWPNGVAGDLRRRAAVGPATSFDEKAGRVLGVLRTTSPDDASAWVVVQVDASEPLSTVYRTIAGSWFGFVALVVVGGLVAGRVLRARLRRQVETLLVAARAIAKGDFAVRVGDTTDDELGTVADALDEMAAELNETRDQRRQSDERYRVIFDEADDAVVIFTDEGTLLDANAAATRLFGRSVAVLRVTPFLDLVTADDPLDRHAEALRTDGKSSGRGVVHGSAGDVPVDFHGRTVAGVGILVLFRDRRPALEAERMRLALVLQDRLAALGTLAAGVGHELNNPLAYVSGNLELLDRMLDDAALAAADTSSPAGATSREARRVQARQLLADARSGAARMRHIVAELNLFSRAQRAPGDGVVVDVAAEIRSAADIARHGVRGQARVDIDVAPSLPPVAGDEGRIAQVVLNLLTNAAQAMPAARDVHENVIAVRACAADDGAVVVIDVVDNATGIDAAVLPHIFEPFFSTKDRNEGTGLGLSVSRELVLAMGGTIDVDSVVGCGTTFHVRLPTWRGGSTSTTATTTATTKTATREKTTDPAMPPSSPQPAVVGEAALAGVRVLIVDDDALVARVLRLFLADATVTVVDNVAAGLHAAATTVPDAVLCDLVMPDGGGRAFFDGLQDCAPALRQRVIFMTAGVTSGDLDAFLHATGRPLLNKPVDAATVRAHIADVAGPRSSTDALATP